MLDVLLIAAGGDGPSVTCRPIGAGGLEAAAWTVELPGPPAVLAVSPGARLLYVDLQVGAGHQVRSFRLDPPGAHPVLAGPPAPIGPAPCYLTTDRAGRFLLSAYYSDAMATVHAIDASGAAGALVERRPTAHGAHCIQTDPANRYAFVPHVAEENAIWQFRFDPATGRLDPNAVPKACPGPGQGPRHLCFHPGGRLAFSNGEQGNTVTAWSHEALTGTLTPLQTLSTLPAGWTGLSHCSQLPLTPDGRFLYCGNRGHDSLAGFAVDGASGALQPLGQFAAEPAPRPMAIDPSGRWLFCAGRTPLVVTYSIDPDSGALERVAQIETGPVGWLATARLA
jgi:6-phosphogluconolactonase